MKRFLCALMLCALLTGFAASAEEIPAGFDPESIAAERGSRGEIVRTVQTALIEGGYLNGNADAVFGKQTAAAVKAWQTEKGYEASGRLTAGQFYELCPDGIENGYIDGYDSAPGWEVYVSPSGEKYHRYNCYTIRDHPTRGMSREAAAEEGYKPCWVCKPDGK